MIFGRFRETKQMLFVLLYINFYSIMASDIPSQKCSKNSSASEALEAHHERNN